MKKMDALLNLKGEMVKNGITQKEMSEKLGINKCTMIRKMKGESEFTLGEIISICNELPKSDSIEIIEKFF